MAIKHDRRYEGGGPGKLPRKHERTLAALFESPTRADITWRSIEALFEALDGIVSEGSGSRVHVILNGVRAVFHRPHPRNETNKGAVNDVRAFLGNAGIGRGDQ